MIEINVLPDEYRPVERTPLPIYVGLLGGIVLLGITFIFYISLWSKTSQLKEAQKAARSDVQQLQDLVRFRAAAILEDPEEAIQLLEDSQYALPPGLAESIDERLAGEEGGKAPGVDELVQEIQLSSQDLAGIVNSVLNLKTQRIEWSKKLFQLAQLLNKREFKSKVWLTSLRVNQGSLAMNFEIDSVKDQAISDYNSFRTALSGDTNLMYHFDASTGKVENFRIDQQGTDPDKRIIRFSLVLSVRDLTIKPPADDSKKKKRGR